MNLNLIKIFNRWFIKIQPVDVLLPISIVLHTFQDKPLKTTSLGLLVIWMTWRLLVPLLQGVINGDRNFEEKFQTPLILLLGLLLINTRMITLRTDLQGAVQFLLIALGVLVGSLLSQRQWKHTLTWLGIASLPLSFLFLHEAIASGFPLVLSSVKPIFNTRLDGYGSLNRFATLLVMVTMASWYSFILNRGLLIKGITLAGAISGYLLCVGSGSRMATWAVPISALMAWLVMRLKGRSKKFWALAISLIALLAIALILWWYLGPNVRDNVYSDSHRLAAAVCWLSGMLSGNNRFIYGVGWSNEKLNEFCYHIPNHDHTLGHLGHGHNTLAQMGGHHGLLGIIALMMLVILIVRGLLRQQSSIREVLPLGFRGTTWPEMALGINFALAFNALSTTIHHRSQVNQILIGLLAATALCVIKPASDESSQERF